MDANNNQDNAATNRGKEYNFIIEGRKMPKKVTVQFKKNDKKEQILIRIIKKKIRCINNLHIYPRINNLHIYPRIKHNIKN